MDVHGNSEQREINLTNGDEIDTVRLATYRRAQRISPLDIPHRGLRRDLNELTHELSRTLAAGENPRIQSTQLDHVRSELALEAMKWVLNNDNFDPNYFGRDLTAMLARADGSDRAA